MRVLVIGSGGREHAMVWKLHQEGVALCCAPGIPGISEIAECLPRSPSDLAALAECAQAKQVDLTLVGPEAPLAAGIVDVFAERGARAFGPTRSAALLESSKVFMKRLCRRYGIPTAPFQVFDAPGPAAPARWVSREMWGRTAEEILEPPLWAMAQDGSPFRGVLFAGLMLTAEGPQVLEFNVRLGDPETQVLLPLLDGGLAEAAEAVLSGRVERWVPRWRPQSAVCVVLGAEGYPASPRTGRAISGLGEAAACDQVLVFHAGTASRDGRLVSAGGRVVNVVGVGPTLDDARDRAYRAV